MIQKTCFRYFSNATSYSTALEKYYNINGKQYDRVNDSDAHELRDFKTKYSNNKELYIIQAFNQDYPDTKVFYYNKIETLMQRSKHFQLWYREKIEEYSRLSTCPDWILEDDTIRDEWKTQYIDVNRSLKQRLQEIKQEEDAALKEYRDKLELCGRRRGEEHIKAFRISPLIIVDKLNSNSLPHSIYINSLKEETVAKADEYLAQELKTYKTSIYTGYLKGTMSKDELLNLLSLPVEKG